MMDPQHERLNERLERPGGPNLSRDQDERYFEKTREDELVNLAHHLQAAPQLRVDAGFADALEQRLLHHQSTMRQQKTVQRRSPAGLWLQRSLLAAIVALSLLFLAGLGVFVLAMRTTNPTNPLYTIKQWTQPGTITPTASFVSATATDQATLDLQGARAHLNTLMGLTTAAQTDEYVQTLSSFDQQLNKAANTINALPAGTEKTQLSSQLSLLKSDARQKLRRLLPTLTSTASAATTTELGHLGESVPIVSTASIVLPAHPNGTATIRITGSGIQPGAQLLVDGKRFPITGTLQGQQIVFVLSWKSEKHPRSLGIINPDGTVAQTTYLTVTTSTDGKNGNGDGHGNG